MKMRGRVCVPSHFQNAESGVSACRRSTLTALLLEVSSQQLMPLHHTRHYFWTRLHRSVRGWLTGVDSSTAIPRMTLDGKGKRQ